MLTSTQVILSFLFTAWFSYAIALITFLFVDNPVLDDAATRLDFVIISFVRKHLSSLSKPFRSASRGLMQEASLMLGDQQLVTGGSILVVCFSTKDDISQYHFIVGASLAFASFATVLNIVFISGEILRKSRLKKTWRFSWILFITIAVTLSNFVFEDQEFLLPNRWGTSTRCVWDNLGTYDHPSKVRLAICTAVAGDGLLSTARFQWPSSPIIGLYDGVISTFLGTKTLQNLKRPLHPSLTNQYLFSSLSPAPKPTCT